MAKKLSIFLIVSLSLWCCQPKETWHTSTLLFFDTVCELRLHGTAAQIKHAQSLIHTLFSDIEHSFSPTSQDLCSSRARHLFKRGLQIHRQTHGCFDVTVGPLLHAWGFYKKSYRVPDPEEIERALDRVGMERVRFKEGCLKLSPGMRLDWGAIAKGFGIDLASRRLIQEGISRGFLNAGGDVYCWGKNPQNKDWKIGVQHPRQRGYLGILSISGQAAATTGDYQRFFKKDGTRYHHVFDPRTGYPARGKRSVTVIGPETLLCDALSTALFVSHHPKNILDHYPQYGAVILDSEGNLHRLGKSFPFQSY